MTAALVAGGELLLPKDGIEAWVTRTAAWLAMPLVLWACGFLTREERSVLRVFLRPSAVRARLAALRERGPTESSEGGGRLPPEVYEQAMRDEDRI